MMYDAHMHVDAHHSYFSVGALIYSVTHEQTMTTMMVAFSFYSHSMIYRALLKLLLAK